MMGLRMTCHLQMSLREHNSDWHLPPVRIRMCWRRQSGGQSGGQSSVRYMRCNATLGALEVETRLGGPTRNLQHIKLTSETFRTTGNGLNSMPSDRIFMWQ